MMTPVGMNTRWTNRFGPNFSYYIGMIPILLCLGVSSSAWAWGEEGHEVVASIALNFMAPAQKARLQALLASDEDPLTAHDPVSVASWADRLREAPGSGRTVTFQHSRAWHFVDIDRHHPDLMQACQDFPLPSQNTLASAGPERACVVAKIEQFSAELARYKRSGFQPADRPEAVLALKFLIHLIGDLHQPLHAIDDHDRGGNEIRVKWDHLHAGSLHHYWDTVFIEQMDPDPARLAQRLSARITPDNLQEWQRGTPRAWAMESFATARSQAYDPLPAPDEKGHYALTDAYAHQAMAMIALQLEEAGVRLAKTLDDCL
ncbi:S1/P1 nuclease [Ferrovum myxofaciens]|uniref:S1/P1 nuclease n=1 Tax=Ferrovum myxofaciens TaxID=416213 RepID=UPI0023575E0A|nr:S1/P1 nuclease [Ferrovum myxofaciens]MBU6994392.1 hypothetical protein [Ferrovum myxofaciens]